METEAGRNARETLDLAFQISNILETGLDRHTLSILIALCDRGLNPEALAALIREFASPPAPNPTLHNPTSSASPAAAPKDLSSLSRLHLQP